MQHIYILTKTVDGNPISKIGISDKPRIRRNSVNTPGRMRKGEPKATIAYIERVVVGAHQIEAQIKRRLAGIRAYTEGPYYTEWFIIEPDELLYMVRTIYAELLQAEIKRRGL